jgi:hypothetical protein
VTVLGSIRTEDLGALLASIGAATEKHVPSDRVEVSVDWGASGK